MASIDDIAIDDHLGRSIPLARNEALGALAEQVIALPPEHPQRKEYELASILVKHVAQSMIDVCAETTDRDDRKSALLHLLQESFQASLVAGHGGMVMQAMEHFVSEFEHQYEQDRQTFIRNKDYVRETITRHATNVELVPIKGRDPQRMFAESHAYLRMAEAAKRTLFTHLMLHEPSAQGATSIAQFLHAEWQKTYPEAGSPLDEAQLTALVGRANYWAKQVMEPYADVLPSDAPMELLGCIEKVDSKQRRQAPAVVDVANNNRVDPRVRRELGKVFKTEAYADAGRDLHQLVQAYRLFERLPDPPTPFDSSAAQHAGGQGRA